MIVHLLSSLLRLGNLTVHAQCASLIWMMYKYTRNFCFVEGRSNYIVKNICRYSQTHRPRVLSPDFFVGSILNRFKKSSARVSFTFLNIATTLNWIWSIWRRKVLSMFTKHQQKFKENNWKSHKKGKLICVPSFIIPLYVLMLRQPHHGSWIFTSGTLRVEIHLF